MNIYTKELYFDEPIEYKNLKFYPVTMKDYFLFGAYSSCLDIDKNSIPDKEVIKMTYLDFLYKKTIEDPAENPYIFWLDRLLALVLKDDSSFDNFEKSLERYKIDESGNLFFEINNKKYTDNDFQEIREIIAKQNNVELFDKNISKEVRKSLEEAQKYKQKLNNAKIGTIEDYVVSLAIATGWSYEYIYNLSIRKFMKSIQRLDNLIHYKIYLSASMSGMVEFKDKSFIKHWLTNLDSDDKYGDVSVSLDSVQEKLSIKGATG